MSAESNQQRSDAAVDVRPIQTLLARLEDEYHPLEVWLFGSRARGASNDRSDWDLLVVLPDDASDQAFDPLTAWRLQKNAGVTADIVLCRNSEFQTDRATVNTVAYAVAREGIRILECRSTHRE